jgi:nicotinamidase-related amidase
MARRESRKSHSPGRIICNGQPLDTVFIVFLILQGDSHSMPAQNQDLHGNVPDKSDLALVLIDVINDLEFDGGEQLLRHALPMARKLAVLKKRAAQMGVPAIYVNDNFGRWRSDFHQQVDHCLQAGVRGRPVVETLRPQKEDYFVLKPKHSGFYSTTLSTLLDYLEVKTLILTGVAGNNCVLFTANDAYMRDYFLVVPGDCVASINEEDNRQALAQMQKVLKADVRPSPELDFDRVRRAHHQCMPGQRAE